MPSVGFPPEWGGGSFPLDLCRAVSGGAERLRPHLQRVAEPGAGGDQGTDSQRCLRLANL